jgi:hypothetical protein
VKLCNTLIAFLLLLKAAFSLHFFMCSRCTGNELRALGMSVTVGNKGDTTEQQAVGVVEK